MIFNGTKKDYLKVSRKKTRPAFAPMERGFVSVTGMPGAHLSRSNRQIRQLDIPVRIEGQSITDLQKVKENLAEWLVHDDPKELTFSDEPDRVYYAVVSGSLDLDELVRWGQGIITFLCPDPFKYGLEKTLTFNTDAVVVENKGTAEADPIFELTAKEKTTFAMISDGTNYNLIGQPTDVDEVIVDEKSIVFSERGENLKLWDTDGTSVDGEVDGELTTDGTGIVVQNYGNDAGWHGPALIREITPIQDFEIEMKLRVESEKVNNAYRIEFYLFDENMNVLGKMALMDSSRAKVQYSAEGRYGKFEGKHASNYLLSSNNYLRERAHFHGMLRMRRIGKRFEFYVTRIGHNEEGFLHHDSLTKVYNDLNNEHQGKLKYVQIHIGKYGDTPAAKTPRINAIEVSERNQVAIDQTPYILDAGDVVEFNHKDDEILINGEPRNDLKNFGGSFFKLNKGDNTLLVTPEDSFDTQVTLRDKYL